MSAQNFFLKRVTVSFLPVRKLVLRSGSTASPITVVQAILYGGVGLLHMADTIVILVTITSCDLVCVEGVVGVHPFIDAVAARSFDVPA